MEAEIVKQIRQPPAMLGLLDFCKGIAIVWVMLVHAIHGWFGWQGVHVFIVLGGFALTYACLTRENQLSWSQWFQRRAARILPAYWLVAAFHHGEQAFWSNLSHGFTEFAPKRFSCHTTQTSPGFFFSRGMGSGSEG